MTNVWEHTHPAVWLTIMLVWYAKGVTKLQEQASMSTINESRYGISEGDVGIPGLDSGNCRVEAREGGVAARYTMSRELSILL